MGDLIHGFAATGVQIITLAAAFLLLLGFAISSLRWVMQAAREGLAPAYQSYRMKIGRTVLIGLEVLLAATILKTIVTPPHRGGAGADPLHRGHSNRPGLDNHAGNLRPLALAEIGARSRHQTCFRSCAPRNPRRDVEE